MVTTRFAPSPTGALHIGGLRTAIYAYALAKHEGGKFILRIEDTDTKREVPGSKEEIKKILKLFGLLWDEFYVQSERVAKGIYEKAAKELVENGHAFYCECKSKNAKEEGFSTELRDPCRNKNLKSGAIKLRVPDKETVKYTDYVLDKEVSWDTSIVPDTTLLKSDGFPTYHLGVVVDDHDMGVTHVLRGHDWMPSTPIHLLVYKFLGFDLPQIGHLTDILDPEGGKLSKRKGSVSVTGMISEGYLPEAIANFVILLGWAPKNERELFTLKEFVEIFDPKGFQKSNPDFNRKKLDWFNGEYIRRLEVEELKSKLENRNSKFKSLDKDKQMAITTLIQSRIKTLAEFDNLAGFFFKYRKFDSSFFEKDYKKHIKGAIEVLENLKSWTKEALDKALLGLIDRDGFKTGDFFMNLRVAVAGSRFTPPINESIVILGKEETLKRLKEVLI